MHEHSDDGYEPFIDGGPTWVRVVQAVLIGLVAGLALHALLSMVVLQGSEPVAAPKECRKGNAVKAPQQLKVPAAARPAA